MTLENIRMMDDNVDVMFEEQEESWIIVPPVSFFFCVTGSLII